MRVLGMRKITRDSQPGAQNKNSAFYFEASHRRRSFNNFGMLRGLLFEAFVSIPGQRGNGGWGGEGLAPASTTRLALKQKLIVLNRLPVDGPETGVIAINNIYSRTEAWLDRGRDMKIGRKVMRSLPN